MKSYDCDAKFILEYLQIKNLASALDLIVMVMYGSSDPDGLIEVIDPKSPEKAKFASSSMNKVLGYLQGLSGNDYSRKIRGAGMRKHEVELDTTIGKSQ